MKTAVIYHSNTGFTKRYAEWIAGETGADCFELSAAKKKDFSGYGAIVFGGWACAGSIRKLRWFKDNLDRWTGKKLIAFCVGGNPPENPEILPALKKNFSGAELDRVEVFYCPGGMNYEKMSAPLKLLMRIFVHALKAKKDKTETEEETIKQLSSSYDLSDKKYIAPIVSSLAQ